MFCLNAFFPGEYYSSIWKEKKFKQKMKYNI